MYTYTILKNFRKGLQIPYIFFSLIIVKRFTNIKLLKDKEKKQCQLFQLKQH